jgi:hypothetical protein
LSGLGALGALGALGPVGSHGFDRNPDGDYLDRSGRIVTSVSADWNSSLQLQWPLFEKYTFDRAQQLSAKQQLDTSFMTTSIVGLTPADTFVIRSTEQQILTIIVVPFMLNANFYLEVDRLSITKNGNATEEAIIIASSKTDKLINWVQFQTTTTPSGQSYRIKISSHPLNCWTNIGCHAGYYLHVIGSTKWMLRKQTLPYRGEYILQ